MTRFTGLLRRTASRLDVPEPARSQVLLEMSADLEDLFSAYRERGLSEEDAVRKVEEKFDVSDETLGDLSRLYRNAFRRGTDRLSDQASTVWEKVVLVLLLLFVLVASGGLVASPDFFASASDFVWAGVVVGAAALAVFLVKGHQLFLKQDSPPRALRSGLPALLFLASASLFIGVFGFFYGLMTAMTSMAADRERAGLLFMRWALGSSATIIVCFLVALCAALFWFVLVNRVKRLEMTRAALLLEESS
jgi:hypothetical protein